MNPTPDTASTSRWVLEADEFDPDDETMDAEEEAELARALHENVRYDALYRSGKIPVRVTHLVEDEYRTYWTFADGPAADRYEVVIGRSADAGGFRAQVPQLPGCAAAGATQMQALANVRAAIDAWIDAAVTEGRDIPVPSPLAIAA